MLLPQLPQFWLDSHHCDTHIDIIIPCAAHASAGPPKPSITGYCLCETGCNGVCGPVSLSAGLNGQRQHVIASLPCHRVLLSAASTYFSALLGPTWSDGSPSSIKRIPIVLSDVEDVPAMIALLKCIYTSEVDLHTSDLAAIASITYASITTTTTSSISSSSQRLPVGAGTDNLGVQVEAVTAAAPAGAGYKCCCTSALQELQASFSNTCWQELSVRVLRLADQFSVPGALTAAVSKLSCLFSYQLSWPAVLAVLWLPAAVAQQPTLKELRQMAINRVTQDMKHLDPCLATPLGRSILQHLPPDALATLLASDQLALLSENSTLAAIDIWLAGPVASSLATAAADDVTFDHLNAGVTGGDAAATGGRVLAPAVGRQRLAAVLQLLLRQVRLPLCSGAFLAATVSQRPWLCLGMQGSHELSLMQQYYRADSHGRYELAMQLLRSGLSCPWSVMLRRGLPATYSASSSSLYAAENTITSSSHTNSSVSTNSAANAVHGFGAYTGLSQIRGLLDWNLQEKNGSTALSRQGSMYGDHAAGVKGLVQQQQRQQQFGAAAAAAMGITLDERVLGGYFWQLSLVAVPESSSSSSECATCVSCSRVAAAAAVATCEPTSVVAHNTSKTLCLLVTCRPAWANVLDSSNPEYEAAAVCHSVSDTAAAAVAGSGDVCEAALDPLSPGREIHGRCSTCDALWTIAGAKAAEAVARHTPITQQLFNAPAAACCCMTEGMDAAAAADAPMHICSETTGSMTAASTGMIHLTDSCSEIPVPGFRGRQGSCSGSSTARLVHLDVVVGIQLLASPSRDQLQQQAGDTAAKNGSLSHALTHLPCLLTWDAKEGAARGLIPINVKAIGSGSNVLSKERSGAIQRPAAAAGGAAGEQAQPELLNAAGGGGVGSRTEVGVGSLPGWQPEVWSGLAPGGALYWHCSLRPLMD